jgi:hypothetical protein
MAIPMSVATAQLNREATNRELCPHGRGVARTVRIGDGVQIQGAGSSSIKDTTVYAWSGSDCIAWVAVAGAVTPTTDESRVDIADRGSFVVRIENGPVSEYRLQVNGGVVAETFTVDGRVREIGAIERTWIAEAVAEYMRRAGLKPQARAARIVHESGIAGLLSEAARIPRDEIKAEYLIVGLLSTPKEPAARVSYLRESSAMLGQGSSLARLLLAVPTDWFTTESVLLATLTAAAQVEVDDGAEAVLGRALPGKPGTPAVAEAARRVIMTLGNSERRAVLLARYGGSMP